METRDGHDSERYNSIRIPITISWKGVKYSVVEKKGLPCKPTKSNKKILHGVSGITRPGQLLAIMGSTGAGKSSLLDVLAQRKSKGNVKGEILINGKPPDKYLKRLSAYVTQDDALPGLLTVRETLSFYADLKLPSTVKKEERNRLVDEVIAELGLEKVANSRVGTQFVRGISGGEKKRLSIGCQLITNPGLLFLDEPTTGLDAYNSQGVLEVLNRLCKRGRTIICTIHQPRSTIYELFDQLMILSQGRTVYFGPASNAVPYFGNLGYHCGQFINPADYFIDITVMNEGVLLEQDMSERRILLDSDKRHIEQGQHTNFAIAFKKSEQNKNIKDEIKKSKQHFATNPVGLSADISEFASTWLKQTLVLALRTFRLLLRNPMATYVQLFQTIFIALLVGSIYFQINDNQGSIQDRVGALFFVMTNQAFSMIASLNLFLEERDLFNRERASGCYRTSAYFISKTVVEAPILLLFPFLFGTIAYWMVGFQATAACFGVFLATIVSFAAVASSLFMAIGSISPNVVIAQILSPLTIVLMMLFGGFYVNTNSIPNYYIWLYYISFFNYGFEILCYNEFYGWGNPLQFTCNSTAPTCIENGTQELYVLGYEDVTNATIRNDFIILWSMVIGYRIIAYLALRFFHKEKR